MEWIYSQFKDDIYDATKLKTHEKEIKEWCEKQELNLKSKQFKILSSSTLWDKHKKLYTTAKTLQEHIGTDEFNDFNLFKSTVEKTLKDKKIKLNASEKNSIYNAISWYDEKAIKVIKKTHKFKKERLEELLEYLNCKKEGLADFGYYKTDKANEYIEYESDTDLRDSENIPIKDNIHTYYLEEVKPHVEEAWINLSSTKIGYEISFNKYFFKHKPLRTIEEVTKDILSLEKQSDGLIKEILGL